MGLLWIHLLLACAMPMAMWTTIALLHGRATTLWYIRSTRPNFGMAATWDSYMIPHSIRGAVLAFPALMAIVFTLTWIEVMGVRFFGRRRQWRVTRGVAWSVCAHAAVGWTIGGLLHAITPGVLQACSPLLDRLAPGTAVRMAVELACWAPIGAFIVGMLVFETLVYLGVRECRYANAPREAGVA